MDRLAQAQDERKLRKANGGMYFSNLGGGGTERIVVRTIR